MDKETVDYQKKWVVGYYDVEEIQLHKIEDKNLWISLEDDSFYMDGDVYDTEQEAIAIAIRDTLAEIHDLNKSLQGLLARSKLTMTTPEYFDLIPSESHGLTKPGEDVY